MAAIFISQLLKAPYPAFHTLFLFLFSCYFLVLLYQEFW